MNIFVRFILYIGYYDHTFRMPSDLLKKRIISFFLVTRRKSFWKYQYNTNISRKWEKCDILWICLHTWRKKIVNHMGFRKTQQF